MEIVKQPKMVLHLAMSMVAHVNVLRGQMGSKKDNASIIYKNMKGLVTKIPLFSLTRRKTSVILARALSSRVHAVISHLVIGNGCIALKIVVLAYKSELEHAHPAIMLHVPKAKMKGSIRKDHVKFKNVLLAKIMRIIAIIKSIQSARILFKLTAKKRFA